MTRLSHKPIAQKFSTIHGTHYLSINNKRSSVVWLFIMISNAALTIAFLIAIQRKYASNQFYTKVDATAHVSQVPFPTVSICNFNVVSSRETKQIAHLLKHYHIPQEDIKSFFHDLKKSINFKFDSNINKYVQIMTILKYHYYSLDTIMEEIHQKCEDLLLYCAFNGKQKDCKNLFSLIKTYDGYCCAFNYYALNDDTENSMMPRDEDIDYYIDRSNSEETTSVIATSESGRLSGLYAVLNIEPNDYPEWIYVENYGAKILISDPNDFPETTVLYKYVTLEQSVDISVEPMIFDFDNSIRSVSVHDRRCWFHDEMHLGHTDRYSFETCWTECKMKNYLEACGCIPFKYPIDRKAKICGFKDLNCINNITVYTLIKPCLCFLECRDKKYKIIDDITPLLLEKNIKENITKHHNVSDLASLRVYYGSPTCNRYTLMLLIDLDYVIATYGGVFSLSFGGSIITLCEISYLVLSFVIETLWRFVLNVINRNKIN